MARRTAGIECARLGRTHTAPLLIGTDGYSKKVVRAQLGLTEVTHPGAASARGDLERLTGVGSGKERGNT